MMRRSIGVAKYCGIVVLCALVARSAWAQAPVTACGTNITVSGSYFLDADLTCNPGVGAAIAINANDVDLNLAAHKLIGPGVATSSVAIAVGTTSLDCSSATGPITNVRVHGDSLGGTNDGTITGFSQAIITCQTIHSIFDHVTIQHSSDGIILEDHSNYNFVLANSIASCNIGVEVGANNDGSDVDSTNSIEANTLNLCPSEDQSSGVVVKTAGILLYSGATMTQVTANTVIGEWLNGIDLRPCAAPVGQPSCPNGPGTNYLQQNTVEPTTNTGIRVSGSKGNRIQNNFVARSGKRDSKQADVADDNNNSRGRPCANVWVDNTYRTKIGVTQCIPHRVHK